MGPAPPGMYGIRSFSWWHPVHDFPRASSFTPEESANAIHPHDGEPIRFAHRFEEDALAQSNGAAGAQEDTYVGHLHHPGKRDNTRAEHGAKKLRELALEAGGGAFHTPGAYPSNVGGRGSSSGGDALSVMGTAASFYSSADQRKKGSRSTPRIYVQHFAGCRAHNHFA